LFRLVSFRPERLAGRPWTAFSASGLYRLAVVETGAGGRYFGTRRAPDRTPSRAFAVKPHVGPQPGAGLFRGECACQHKIPGESRAPFDRLCNAWPLRAAPEGRKKKKPPEKRRGRPLWEGGQSGQMMDNDLDGAIGLRRAGILIRASVQGRERTHVNVPADASRTVKRSRAPFRDGQSSRAKSPTRDERSARTGRGESAQEHQIRMAR
jgi:hypothetical protein